MDRTTVKLPDTDKKVEYRHPIKKMPRLEECPQCNNYTIAYDQGCKRCIDPCCGWSACGK